MRLQIGLLCFLLSFSLFASQDKAMDELFLKYDAIMDHQKFELIDEVFTEKFLKDVGGKDEFIANIKELPKNKEKSTSETKLSWREGAKKQMFFAKRVTKSRLKSSKEEVPGPSFIVVEEKGKLKIQGTISDDH